MTSLPSDLLTTSDGGAAQNSKDIRCKICPSKILLAGKGTLVQKPTDLPVMTVKAKVKDGEEIGTEHFTDFWLVEGMYTFENIGFSNAVSGIKYLICADCEQGPVGWCLDSDRQKLYLCHDRVTYQ